MSAPGLVPWLKQLTGAESKEAGIGNRMITCMDTSGQGFAIWLNVLYLLPLTYLFARFFVRSYLYRKEPGKQPTHIHAAERAGLDALKGVSREIQKAVEVNGEASATEDEAKATKAANGTVNGTANGTANGTSKAAANGANGANGVKTRSANKKANQEGFAPVSTKKGAKKGGKETPPSVPEAKGQNPFEVLDGKS